MQKKPLCFLLGCSPFLSKAAQKLADLDCSYWLVQAADLPAYTYQSFPEQSLLLYAQQLSAENQAFLFSVLSQLAQSVRPIIFADSQPFFAAYLARYLSASLYLRSELLSGLDPIERNWILVSPPLKALILSPAERASGQSLQQPEPQLNASLKTLSEAEIVEQMTHLLSAKLSGLH